MGQKGIGIFSNEYYLFVELQYVGLTCSCDAAIILADQPFPTWPQPATSWRVTAISQVVWHELAIFCERSLPSFQTSCAQPVAQLAV